MFPIEQTSPPANAYAMPPRPSLRLAALACFTALACEVTPAQVLPSPANHDLPPAVMQAHKQADELLRQYQVALDEYRRIMDSPLAANPLNRPKQPDLHTLAPSLREVLQPLVGSKLSLDLKVAGFGEKDGKVYVAFTERDCTNADIIGLRLDESHPLPSLRYRTKSFATSAELWFQSYFVDPGKRALEDYLQSHGAGFLGFAIMMGQAREQFFMQNILCGAIDLLESTGLVGVVGNDISSEDARQLTLGSRYQCDVTVTGYSLSWQDGAVKNSSTQLATGETALLLHDTSTEQEIAGKEQLLAKSVSWRKSAATPHIRIYVQFVANAASRSTPTQPSSTTSASTQLLAKAVTPKTASSPEALSEFRRSLRSQLSSPYLTSKARILCVHLHNGPADRPTPPAWCARCLGAMDRFAKQRQWSQTNAPVASANENPPEELDWDQIRSSRLGGLCGSCPKFHNMASHSKIPARDFDWVTGGELAAAYISLLVATHNSFRGPEGMAQLKACCALLMRSPRTMLDPIAQAHRNRQAYSVSQRSWEEDWLGRILLDILLAGKIDGQLSSEQDWAMLTEHDCDWLPTVLSIAGLRGTPGIRSMARSLPCDAAANWFALNQDAKGLAALVELDALRDSELAVATATSWDFGLDHSSRLGKCPDIWHLIVPDDGVKLDGEAEDVEIAANAPPSKEWVASRSLSLAKYATYPPLANSIYRAGLALASASQASNPTAKKQGTLESYPSLGMKLHDMVFGEESGIATDCSAIYKASLGMVTGGMLPRYPTTSFGQAYGLSLTGARGEPHPLVRPYEAVANQIIADLGLVATMPESRFTTLPSGRNPYREARESAERRLARMQNYTINKFLADYVYIDKKRPPLSAAMLFVDLMASDITATTKHEGMTGESASYQLLPEQTVFSVFLNTAAAFYNNDVANQSTSSQKNLQKGRTDSVPTIGFVLRAIVEGEFAEAAHALESLRKTLR